MTLRTALSAAAVGAVLVVTPAAAASATPDYPPNHPHGDHWSVPAHPHDDHPAHVETVSSPSALPQTGSEVAVLGAAAAGLVAGGAGLVVLGRRRRAVS